MEEGNETFAKERWREMRQGEEGWFSWWAWEPWGMELGRRRRVEEGGCRQDQRAVLVRAFEVRGGRVATRVDR